MDGRRYLEEPEAPAGGAPLKLPKNIIYIIVGAIIFLFLFGNAGSRKLVRRFWEIYKLKGELEQLKKENALLKKEIFLLQNDPSYVERITRKELGLIAPGEVEYRLKREE
ncbi:MAG: septum formation initiator family protein [Elusimicrobia bacterium]|nr:septum formation initiator family protein [Candidatus Liberimonas magnetica]